MPPHSQIAPESLEYWWETPVSAPAYATYWGLLKQPDKQEMTRTRSDHPP